jgi:hypothetical protein
MTRGSFSEKKWRWFQQALKNGKTIYKYPKNVKCLIVRVFGSKTLKILVKNFFLFFKRKNEIYRIVEREKLYKTI